jgi:signal transduction histidine kinase
MFRHRWLAVAAAVIFIGIVEGIADTSLDAILDWPWKALVVTAIISLAAGASVWFAVGQIERLRRDLTDRNAALESRNAALRAVYDVSLSVSAQADPDRTIGAIVEHARHLLRADGVLLALDAPNGFLRLRAASAADGVLEPQKDGEIPPTYDDLDCFLGPGFEIRATVAVKHGDKRLGTLALACDRRSTRRFDTPDVETLSALATQVGLAIEAARIQDELQELAIQRERERIARDMHDGLAQVLGYVNTKSQAVSDLLSQGRVEEARTQLGQLEAASRSVFADVREAILNLSGTASTERGVAPALDEYAARLGRSAGVVIRFVATPEAVAAPLSAATQAEVFSIAREALTNVRKHAHARKVDIELRRERAEVVLTIADDGVGFEADVLSRGPERWPHFGLAGMRERAESVGGRVAWRSHPGEGTEVELHVPVGGTSRHQVLERSTPLGVTPGPGSQQAVRSPAASGSEAD